MSKLLFTEGDAPATPATDEVALYAKTDKKLYFKDDAGTETEVGGGGGGGAPDDATYILQVADGDLANAQALSTLQTGDMVVTNSTGVITSLKHNLGATTAPTVSDDNTQNYSVGSRWIDTTNDHTYQVVDVSTGAAIWKRLDFVGPTYVVNTAADAPNGSQILENLNSGAVFVDENTGLLTSRKNTVTTTDPTVNDDSGDGFIEGSEWINTTADRIHDLIDPSAAAAIWRTRGSPQYAQIFFTSANVTVVAGSWTVAIADRAGQALSYVFSQSSAATADAFEVVFELQRGIYTFSVLGQTATYAGIIDWTLDGNAIVANEDWYSSPNVLNVVKSTTSVLVPRGGLHTLRGTIDGKNGSSSGFFFNITAVYFRKTGG